MTAEEQLVLPQGKGETLQLGGFGVVYKLSGVDTGGAFAVVEHPLQPGTLAAPPHTHSNEDEYSFVLEGEVTVQIGDEVFTAGEGSYVIKPRGVPHTFWNAGARPARILEIISPAGFEDYFRELAEVVTIGVPPDFARIGEVAAKYGLTLHPERMGDLIAKYNVKLG